MKVGLTVSSLFPASTAQRMVGLAERMEADSIWTTDHFMGVFHPELWTEMGFDAMGADPDAHLDPFCLIAALGQSTSIPLGVGVTDTVRRGAADLARSAFSLQHLCRGGFNLGLGSGEAENLVPFGYAFERPVARCEEVLSQLRHLLDTGEFPGTGGRIGLPLGPDGERPKVWVAAHGPRMLRLTGEYADGWYPAFAMSPEEYGERRGVIAGHAAAAGRAMPECALQPFVIVGESCERLEELFDAQPLGKLFALFFHGSTWARHGLEHPLGADSSGFVDVIVHHLDPAMLRELAPTIPFELLLDGMFMGSPEELTARIENFARQGAEHVVFANLTGLVGGIPEATARMDDFVRLRALLGDL